MSPAQLRAAVAGQPISHSRSPLLHSTAYALLGAPIDYGRIEAGAEAAPALAARLRSEAGWTGLSATMPLKQALLAEMDELSETARLLGAMNTVVVSRDADGVRLTGHNTDVEGIVLALRAAAGLRAEQSALVLGGGGTAASALAALAQLGFRRVTVAVRTPERAAALVELGAELGLAVDVTSLTSVTRLSAPGAVVSALPPGAADASAEAVASIAGTGVPLLDVAYDPWPSPLAAAWGRAGGTPVHGLAMLVYQAIAQIELFTGDPRARQASVVAALCDAADITPAGAPL
ncbi:shikimate dehydrogenase [Galactobacter valiniphilus]|uniref:shikimate dehydrogenase n=1 Tax=Galactobacter valiniphilus TaxID=2676122 RepID=UPI0037357E34